MDVGVTRVIAGRLLAFNDSASVFSLIILWRR